jgi:hypothetical protein
MSRWWNEFVAAAEGVVPLPLLLLLMLGVATLAALLWYFFPAWVPRRWPRLRLRRPRWRRPRWRRPRLRWRWRWRWPSWRWPGWGWLRRLWPGRRRRRRKAVAERAPVAGAAEEVPEVPAAEFVSLADRLAAEGRFAEAVRERLRGMIRELIERGVLEHRPGWTVTELAAVAARRRPAVAEPLDGAGRIFSDIWYGERPAGAVHDARMRNLAAALSASLNTPVAAGR